MSKCHIRNNFSLLTLQTTLLSIVLSILLIQENVPIAFALEAKKVDHISSRNSINAANSGKSSSDIIFKGPQNIDPLSEPFRAFLQSKSALFSSDLLSDMIRRNLDNNLSSLKRCGINKVLNNPSRAEIQAVNVFTVKFTDHINDFCSASPSKNACYLLKENCITIGNSIFCDRDYLLRIATFADAAILYTWRAIKEAKLYKRDNVVVEPLADETLINFAKSQSTDKGIYSGIFRNTRDGYWFYDLSVFEKSPLFNYLYDVILSSVLAHEMYHLENKICGMAQNIKASNVLFALKTYREIYCDDMTSLAANEFATDIYSISIVNSVLKNGANGLLKAGDDFSKSLDKTKKADLNILMDVAEELAILAIIYTQEYELLVHLDAEAFINALDASHKLGTDPLAIMEHFVKFGAENSKSIERDHIDPVLRFLFLARLLDIGNFSAKKAKKIYFRGTLSRLLPYAAGHLLQIQSEFCKNTDQEYILNFVEDSFTRNE